MTFSFYMKLILSDGNFEDYFLTVKGFESDFKLDNTQ